MKSIWMNFIIGIILCLLGIFMILVPGNVFRLILNCSILFLFIHGVLILFRFIKSQKWMDFFSSLLSFLFMVYLMKHQFFPQWFLRISFGLYCVLSGLISFIQFYINFKDNLHGRIKHFVFFIAYVVFGLYLLMNEKLNIDLLLQLFGVYFIILGLYYIVDGYENINSNIKYKWKRKVHIMLPPMFCAILPDYYLNEINKYLAEGKPEDLITYDHDAKVRLKILVQMGDSGFKKIGHICFSFDDIVYSYGNYDSDSFRFNQTIGDGTFFLVDLENYIPNMLDYESNTVFEFGVYTTEKQNIAIEKEISKIMQNSSRWYCKYERDPDFKKYESDYPSRLHYRTGAKYYKIVSGRFRKYWAMGDNCALFTDLVLGVLGADVLSVRGIITPGTYLQWLQNESYKENSPIAYRNIYTKKEEN